MDLYVQIALILLLAVLFMFANTYIAFKLHRKYCFIPFVVSFTTGFSINYKNKA